MPGTTFKAIEVLAVSGVGNTAAWDWTIAPLTLPYVRVVTGSALPGSPVTMT